MSEDLIKASVNKEFKNKDISKEVFKEIQTQAKKAFTKKEVDNIVKDLEKFFTVESEEVVKATAAQVKEEAKNFLTTLNKLAQTEDDILKNTSSLGSATKNFEARTYRLRIGFLAAYKFAFFIQKYNNQPLAKTLVVFQDDAGNPITYEYNFFDFIKGIGSQGHIHGEWLLNGLKKDEQNVENLINSQEHIQMVRRAYNIIKYKLTFDKYGEEEDLILLKSKQNSKKWEKVNVLNYGDLNEAYASALMQEHQSKYDAFYKVKNKNDDEEIAYTFFHKYIAKVDNREAILGEDLILKEMNVQYAIKSSNAQLPSFNQYVRTAYNILQMNDVKKAIQKEKEKYSGVLRNKVREIGIAKIDELDK